MVNNLITHELESRLFERVLTQSCSSLCHAAGTPHAIHRWNVRTARHRHRSRDANHGARRCRAAARQNLRRRGYGSPRRLRSPRAVSRCSCSTAPSVTAPMGVAARRVGRICCYPRSCSTTEGGVGLGKFLAVGRPEKNMPKFALPRQRVAEIAAFLHARVGAASEGRSSRSTSSSAIRKRARRISTGPGAARRCHSVTGDGDLARIGAKYDPVMTAGPDGSAARPRRVARR